MLCCEHLCLTYVQEDRKYQCTQESDLVLCGDGFIPPYVFSIASAVVVCADLVRISDDGSKVLEFLDSLQFLAIDSVL